jgi:hypothetical protein
VEEQQLVSPSWQCARSHITCCSKFLTSKNIIVIPQPSHSPDLTPSDFFLFPKMKLQLKGCCFDIIEQIHAVLQEVIVTRLRTSRDACNHGKYAGITVYMPKGTTSTVETRSCTNKLFFMVKFP